MVYSVYNATLNGKISIYYRHCTILKQKKYLKKKNKKKKNIKKNIFIHVSLLIKIDIGCKKTTLNIFFKPYFCVFLGLGLGRLLYYTYVLPIIF